MATDQARPAVVARTTPGHEDRGSDRPAADAVGPRHRRYPVAADAVLHRAKDSGSGGGSSPSPGAPTVERPSRPDPGTVAVESGLSERQPDGSVVFRQADAPPPTDTTTLAAPDGAMGPAAAPDVTDLEQPEAFERLFRRLYPRVRDELRWDLLSERERTGLLTDLDR